MHTKKHEKSQKISVSTAHLLLHTAMCHNSVSSSTVKIHANTDTTLVSKLLHMNVITVIACCFHESQKNHNYKELYHPFLMHKLLKINLKLKPITNKISALS